MKYLLNILFLISFTLQAQSDFQNHVSNYINNNGTARSGICIDLIYDIFSTYDKDMVIDTNRAIWGEPVFENPQKGDILIYGNHIAIVYDYSNDELFIADQNSGYSESISIRKIDLTNIDHIIYRPISLEDLREKTGIDEEVKYFINLFTIDTKDNNKYKRSKYFGDINTKIAPYFLDTNFKYTNIEQEFYKHYKHFNMVICPVLSTCFINSNGEKIYVDWCTSRMYLKPSNKSQ